jgi:hypothetical protein
MANILCTKICPGPAAHVREIGTGPQDNPRVLEWPITENRIDPLSNRCDFDTAT